MKNRILNVVALLLCVLSNINAQTSKPNIIIIYADDMGYGDLNCQNPNSKIPTPNLDQLAAEGMRFTDAHSSSGICSPSRFALLTGTYHWRRTHNIVNAFGKPMFNDSDVTIPELLKTKGYVTAAIGKWHLGWDWKFNREPTGEVLQWGKKRKFYKPEDVDWTNPIKGGPLGQGFDYYFGDGTINFPPYAWIENENFVKLPNTDMDPNNVGYGINEGSWEFRPGPKVKGWNPYEVLPALTKKTVSYIQKQEKDKPFFLYMALPSPHAPIIPNDEFVDKSKAGPYGDFMFQTDWVVGQILKTLKEKALDQNTIVIFSADNGPEKYAFTRAEKFDHYSMGDFRGLKRDVWEGGHHVPFIVKWPGHIMEGTVSNALVSQIDIMSTIAEITNTPVNTNVAPDSKSFLSVLKDKNKTGYRDVIVHNTYKDTWGIREGKWLYINKKTGQHSKMPDSFKKLKGYKDFNTDNLLFNLEKDPEQRVNLSLQHPDKIAKMEKLLKQEINKGYLID
ncbi:arylsulfatase [Tamlana sp. 2201CG12-4]|uniref:sulfatase family protein n=1 Tax=Tamlana sp. 2201CG12-4 TaxID=3112582 RepID=UPI002DB66346|nr:arylsulfatase [Tamlana sp. 2201CG12-4]MEC3908408.1 arylsulfatase [Tamlana sp. 2201CG12-4]